MKSLAWMDPRAQPLRLTRPISFLAVDPLTFDPETGLPFVAIPPKYVRSLRGAQHLHGGLYYVFREVNKYRFGPATGVSSERLFTTQKRILIVTPTALYTLDSSGSVRRAIPLDQISALVLDRVDNCVYVLVTVVAQSQTPSDSALDVLFSAKPRYDLALADESMAVTADLVSLIAAAINRLRRRLGVSTPVPVGAVGSPTEGARARKALQVTPPNGYVLHNVPVPTWTDFCLQFPAASAPLSSDKLSGSAAVAPPPGPLTDLLQQSLRESVVASSSLASIDRQQQSFVISSMPDKELADQSPVQSAPVSAGPDPSTSAAPSAASNSAASAAVAQQGPSLIAELSPQSDKTAELRIDSLEKDLKNLHREHAKASSRLHESETMVEQLTGAVRALTARLQSTQEELEMTKQSCENVVATSAAEQLSSEQALAQLVGCLQFALEDCLGLPVPPDFSQRISSYTGAVEASEEICRGIIELTAVAGFACLSTLFLQDALAIGSPKKMAVARTSQKLLRRVEAERNVARNAAEAQKSQQEAERVHLQEEITSLRTECEEAEARAAKAEFAVIEALQAAQEAQSANAQFREELLRDPVAAVQQLLLGCGDSALVLSKLDSCIHASLAGDPNSYLRASNGVENNESAPHIDQPVGLSHHVPQFMPPDMGPPSLMSYESDDFKESVPEGVLDADEAISPEPPMSPNSHLSSSK